MPRGAHDSPPTASASAPRPSTVPWATAVRDMLKRQLGAAAQTDAIVNTITAALAPTTQEAYGSHFARFVRFCDSEPDRPSALPATTGTVLRWLSGDVCARGSVKAASLQPYLSAVNAAHDDLGFQKPALGHLVARFRSGLAHLQNSAGRDAERVLLPAPIVQTAHDWALGLDLASASARQLSAFRAAVATVLNYCFFARGATGSALCCGDVRRTNDALLITLAREKGKAKNQRSRVLSMPLGSVRGLDDLLKKWELFRGACADNESFFVLPAERSAATKLRPIRFASTSIDRWVHEILDHLDLQPPPGDKWSGHSERKGAASAAAAIGVSLNRICWCGGWSIQSSTVHDYIDPTCPPSQAAKRYFGWLRPPDDL